MSLSQLHNRTVKLQIRRLKKSHSIFNQGKLDNHENPNLKSNRCAITNTLGFNSDLTADLDSLAFPTPDATHER